MHLSEEPLMEEYSIAMQVWSLSKVDLAEMAANSVRMSSFEGFLKRRWLGHHWDKKFELEYKGHTYTVPDYKNHSFAKTNVSPTRYHYRSKNLTDEYKLLFLLTDLCSVKKIFKRKKK